MNTSLVWAVREGDPRVQYAIPILIRGPNDSAQLLLPILGNQLKELFVVLCLDAKGQAILPVRLISMGSLSASVVHPREVFREAILAGAASIVVAHCHPSGDPTPSAEDLAVTRRLQAGGELLCVPVVDHIIIGGDRWVSLQQLGMMSEKGEQA